MYLEIIKQTSISLKYQINHTLKYHQKPILNILNIHSKSIHTKTVSIKLNFLRRVQSFTKSCSCVHAAIHRNDWSKSGDRCFCGNLIYEGIPLNVPTAMFIE